MKDSLNNKTQKEGKEVDLTWLSVFQLHALIKETEKLWKLKNSHRLRKQKILPLSSY